MGQRGNQKKLESFEKKLKCEHALKIYRMHLEQGLEIGNIDIYASSQ